MKTSFVSSAAVSQSLRYSLLRAQSELVKAQKESGTGLVADVGLALGARTSQVVNFKRDLERLDGIVDSNALVKSRLSSTQTSLQQISEAAKDFLTGLTAAASGDAANFVTQASARGALDALTSILNTSVNGEHLFAGINTDIKPINGYNDPGSPAKAAFDAAFLAHFGFTQNDAGAAGISAAAMDTFLTTVVEPQFLGAGWQANWSNASDQTIVARIALNETTDASVSANAEPMRKFAMAAASIADLMDSNLSIAGKQELIGRAVALVGEVIGDLAELQSKTGVLEKRVADASERIKMQTNLFEKHILELEGVDPYEAATRVKDLLSHIETSYALTARIHELSLLRYLS